MSEQNRQKLKKVKNNFDKITSQNSTNWKLVIFWIFTFELIATIIEYLSIEKSEKYAIYLTHTITTELVVASIVTLFVWFCIYNIIFENIKNVFKLLVFSILGLYFIVTNDFTLQFLIQNLNPLHFFDFELGVVFLIELLFKLIITYLLFQLLICLKKTQSRYN